MRKIKNVVLYISICFLICGIPVYYSSFGTDSIQNSEIEVTSNKKPVCSDLLYIAVDPINISSSDDWALYPFITGDGSDLYPYVIENVEIHGIGVKIEGSTEPPQLNLSYSGIYIDSNKSFIIRSSFITDFSVGIHLGFDVNISQVKNVIIQDCGLGIFNSWHFTTINISDCQISNCKWISELGATYLNYFMYGGYGIYTSSFAVPSIIQNCHVSNCSIGILISRSINITKNELINCGFFIEKSSIVISLPYVHDDNTVNGKPFKIFYYEDNLTIRQSDADIYGQMLFFSCDNLSISQVTITEPCSFGLYIENYRMNIEIGIESANGTHLENIVCENQLIGMVLTGIVFQANKLDVKNCEIGFGLANVRNSNFTRLLSTECDIPFYIIARITETTIETSPSMSFYMVDPLSRWEGLHVEYERPSKNFDIEPSLSCTFQLDATGLYHITNRNEEIPVVDLYVNITAPRIAGYDIWILISIVAIASILCIRKYCIKTKI